MIDAGLDGYIDGLVDQYVRAVMSPAEARRAVLVRLGGRDPVKEAEVAVRAIVTGLPPPPA